MNLDQLIYILKAMNRTEGSYHLYKNENGIYIIKKDNNDYLALNLNNADQDIDIHKDYIEESFIKDFDIDMKQIIKDLSALDKKEKVSIKILKTMVKLNDISMKTKSIERELLYINSLLDSEYREDSDEDIFSVLNLSNQLNNSDDYNSVLSSTFIKVLDQELQFMSLNGYFGYHHKMNHKSLKRFIGSYSINDNIINKTYSISNKYKDKLRFDLHNVKGDQHYLRIKHKFIESFIYMKEDSGLIFNILDPELTTEGVWSVESVDEVLDGIKAVGNMSEFKIIQFIKEDDGFTMINPDTFEIKQIPLEAETEMFNIPSKSLDIIRKNLNNPINVYSYKSIFYFKNDKTCIYTSLNKI